MTISIVLVEKTGVLKAALLKNPEEIPDLYKKCGFKSAEHFKLQTVWSVKMEAEKYKISLYGKAEGKANMENKYDFPPPVDKILYFGKCALVAHSEKTSQMVPLTVALWEKIYEKLFGGFENLQVTAFEDEYEEDELDDIPNEKKTKHGYLKDGFVVDSSDTEDDELCSNDSEEELEEDDLDLNEEGGDDDDDVILGSELSEEEYSDDDDDDDDKKQG
jgi:hypothetical protein